MDKHRHKENFNEQESEKRIIKILRAGMKPSEGLKESTDSLKDMYPWETGRVAVKSTISIVLCLLGCVLYASDIASDCHFYSSLDPSDEAARIATLAHIMLPLAFSILVSWLYFSPKFSILTAISSSKFLCHPSQKSTRQLLNVDPLPIIRGRRKPIMTQPTPNSSRNLRIKRILPLSQ